MPTRTQSRFGLHVGLNSLAFVNVEIGTDGWYIAGVGSQIWREEHGSLEDSRTKEQLSVALADLARRENLRRQKVSLSLDNRLCITRIVTGTSDTVQHQIEDIAQRSQLYVQLGLGEKLIGTSIKHLDEVTQYAQVSIMKEGLLKGIVETTRQSGTHLVSLEAALPALCRVVGFQKLDQRSPILIVWMGPHGGELGISFKGRLQLHYNLGAANTPELITQTISHHLKRLYRFCDRYRNFQAEKKNFKVLVLAEPEKAQALQELLQPLDFCQIQLLDELRWPTANGADLDERMQPEMACALGSLLPQLEPNAHPVTDLLDRYLAKQPRSWTERVLQTGWPLWVAAAFFLTALGAHWYLSRKLDGVRERVAALDSGADSSKTRQIEIEQHQLTIQEYQLLSRQLERLPPRELVSRIAQCLPDETRLESLSVDAQNTLALRGAILNGNSAYDILISLKSLPFILEVSLESALRSTTLGNSASTFEIKCSLVEQLAHPPIPTGKLVSEPRRQ